MKELCVFYKNTHSICPRIERKLFSDISKGHKSKDLKNSYLKEYGITSRQFNAVRVKLEGKIDSLKALRKAAILRTKANIASLEKLIPLLSKRKKRFSLHQKKRSLTKLSHKLF